MDSTINGIVIPVHKKRVFKCQKCEEIMEKQSEYPMSPIFQAHKPYLIDVVTYQCSKCLYMQIECEHRVDKFGNWIENRLYRKESED